MRQIWRKEIKNRFDMRVIDQVDRHEGSDTMHAAQERVQVDLLLSHIWIFTWQMLRVLGPNVVQHSFEGSKPASTTCLTSSTFGTSPSDGK